MIRIAASKAERDRNETFMRHLSDIKETTSDMFVTIRDGWKKNYKRRDGTVRSLDQGRIDRQRRSSETRQVPGGH